MILRMSNKVYELGSLKIKSLISALSFNNTTMR